MPDLLTGDLQLSDSPRDEYRLKFLQQTLPMLAKGCDRVLILGDLTEAKDKHPAALVNRVVRGLHNLSKLAQLIILRGNHDYADEAHPFFQFLSRFDNIKFISKPTVIHGELFLPHTRDWEKDWGDIDFIPFRRIFAHNTFDGAVGNQGHQLRGIPVNIFPAHGCQVYSGDVHTPQEVGCVTYVGAPYLCDFGDDYDPRVIYLDGEEARSHPIEVAQKRLLELQWPFGKKQSINAKVGDIVKIRVQISQSDLPNRLHIQRQVEEWGRGKGFYVHSVLLWVEYDKVKKPTVVADQKDDKQLVDSYGKRMDLDKGTLKTGHKLVENDDV